jgi:hypothetical protein
MKLAGLGHVTRVTNRKWQATIGSYTVRHVNRSVWVTGPYRSAAQAARLAQSLRRTEIAYAGGRYIATATDKSYLASSASLVAVCLGVGTGSGYIY